MSKKSQYISTNRSKHYLKCHLIFVVKYRHPLLKHVKISTSIKETILAAQTKEFTVDTMEVDVDHIHLLIDYVPQISITQIVRKLKQLTATNIWKVVDLKKYLWAEKTFWSDGYFVCSTGQASTETIRRYIENQG